ncbi:MAG: hypothetical protein QNJ45_13265 [Ardenticatenaceae bacterium]|nr:hypothetical protein [Ardenticatenaceae bacterium]
MSILLGIGEVLGRKAAGTLWDSVTQAYGDWQRGRHQRLSMAITPSGGVQYLQQDQVRGTTYQQGSYAQPIVLSGIFAADDFFVEYTDAILEHDEKVVLLFAFDEETGEVFLSEFPFDGYMLPIWPGVYSLYAFIVDPLLDDLLAIGYPAWGELDDPNPIELTGFGPLDMDFILFDADEDDDDFYDEDW